MQAADFVGPVFLFCELQSLQDAKLPAVIDVKKLNLESRQLVDIAHFPAGVVRGCREIPNQIGRSTRFDAQAWRTVFSRDFQKAVVPPERSGQVAYYDSALGRTVLVNDLIPHPTGDFDTDPSYESASFDADGLLKFYELGSKTWKFFDTESQTVVRESPGPELPAYWPPTVPRGNFDFDDCYAAWSLPDGRYLEGSEDAIYSVPTDGSARCGEQIQRIAPEKARVLALAGDPSGADILMLVAGRENANKLYRANLQDREKPTEIDLNGALGSGLTPAIAIIGWE